MSQLFLQLNEYFRHRKTLLAILLAGFLAGALALGLSLDFEEDISKIMPVDETVLELNELLENSDLTDRLVVNITYADTTVTPENPDELIQFCDSLVAALQAQLDSTAIREIMYKIDESQFQQVYDVLYENLPLFLEESDYKELDELTDTASIEAQMRGAYRALMTPGGSFLKSYVLRDPLSITRLALSKLQTFQIDENYTIHDGYIVTKDFRNLLFFITPTQSARETRINQTMLRLLDENTEAIAAQFDNRVQATYFGGTAVAVDNAVQVRKDVTLTVTIALISLFLLITYFFRRPGIFFLMVLPVIFGAVTALAVLYLIKGTVSIIAIGIGSMLLGITIDYSLHVFTHYRSVRNVRQVIKDLTAPMFISGITTAISFLCLYWIRSEALHDLGLFAALSVVLAAVFALIILPILLPNTRQDTAERQVTILDKIAAYPYSKNRFFLAAVVGMTILCCFTAFDTQFEEDLNKINFMSDKVRAAEQRLNSITSATMRGVYLVSSGETLEEALSYNEKIVAKADSLQQLGFINEYTTASSVLLTPAAQQERINRWNAYWTAEKKQHLQQAISAEATKLRFKPNAFSGFYELLDKDFQPRELSAFAPLIHLLLRDYVHERNGSVTLLSLLRLDQEAKPVVYATFQNQPNIHILDKEFMVSQFVNILQRDFSGLVNLSLLLVFLFLHLSYGRIELAIISFVPILLSWFWTLGLMNLFGLKFNIINVIITNFIFGVGIDYSVFILRGGLLQEYKYGERELVSYKASVLLSALTTLMGMGVLIFAKHPALKSIAGLAIIGIVSVVFLCYVLVPLLFRWLIYTPKGERREYPRTLFNTLKTFYIYGLLGLGSVVVTIIGGLFYLLIFIPKETRKYVVHWLIWQFSRFYIFISFPKHHKIINEQGEDFSRPALIISNHQSHIDTPILFSLHPKLILLTKNWVYQFPLYYFICRMADFFTVANGLEAILPQIRERVEKGYHVAVFPEGSRSETEKVNRFHKGAFYIAEQLQLDILPIYLHGTGRFLRKNSFWGQSNDLTMKIGERIKFDDARFGTDYSERTKKISRFYRNEYEAFVNDCKTTFYYRRQVLENYLYKGPVLENYARVKLKLENYYQIFDELVPKKATITDMGCGYGFLDYMLSLRSEERFITGIDYDAEKIKVAQHTRDKNDRLTFVCADIATYEVEASDVFILADVLHYLTKEEQKVTLERCLHRLSPNGIIIIRDGDRDLTERHVGTRWTEIFSTKFGFNKTRNALHYLSGRELEQWAAQHQLSVRRIDTTKRTSNIIFVLQRAPQPATPIAQL